MKKKKKITLYSAAIIGTSTIIPSASVFADENNSQESNIFNYSLSEVMEEDMTVESVFEHAHITINDDSSLIFSGQLEENEEVVTIYVNSAEVHTEDGQFSHEMTDEDLVEGHHIVVRDEEDELLEEYTILSQTIQSKIDEDMEFIEENETSGDERENSDEESDEIAEEVVEEEAGEIEVELYNTQVTPSSSRTHDNGIYTVRSGDTFYSIAQSFNISQVQLRVWNGYSSNPTNLSTGTELAVTREGVERQLSNEERNYLSTGDSSTVFQTNEEFIRYVAPLAIAIANENGEELWPSLMIAQAAHESAYGRSDLAAPPYHNLSGIKARGDVSRVLRWTWEEIDGERVDVLDYFQTFPSYEAALQRYANFLRTGGNTGDPNYYEGTWRSNTNSVWDVLDNNGLRGYATDSNYYTAIRRIINDYDLTQYDINQIQVEYPGSRSVTPYSGVLNSGYSLDTKPWGASGFETVASTAEYAGEEVRVIRHARNNEYLLIQNSDGVLLGWADHRAVTLNAIPERIPSGINEEAFGVITESGYSIDSRPWGSPGSTWINRTSNYINQQVRVEQYSSNRSYILVSVNGELLGWIDARAVAVPEEVSNSRAIHYPVVVQHTGYSIDTLPWGMSGFRYITRSNEFIGENAWVRRETNNGNYVLLEINGQQIGWVDKNAVTRVDHVQDTSNSLYVNYSSRIVGNGYSIDTLPWGSNGYQTIASTTHFNGVNVNIVRESSNGNYALAEYRGELLGWIDKNALLNPPRVQRTPGTNTNYQAVVRSGYSIDTLPWGTSGYQTISHTRFYEGQRVTVTRETSNYALISSNNRLLGWVDKRALN